MSNASAMKGCKRLLILKASQKLGSEIGRIAIFFKIFWSGVRDYKERSKGA